MFVSCYCMLLPRPHRERKEKHEFDHDRGIQSNQDGPPAQVQLDFFSPPIPSFLNLTQPPNSFLPLSFMDSSSLSFIGTNTWKTENFNSVWWFTPLSFSWFCNPEQRAFFIRVCVCMCVCVSFGIWTQSMNYDLMKDCPRLFDPSSPFLSPHELSCHLGAGIFMEFLGLGSKGSFSILGSALLLSPRPAFPPSFLNHGPWIHHALPSIGSNNFGHAKLNSWRVVWLDSRTLYFTNAVTKEGDGIYLEKWVVWNVKLVQEWRWVSIIPMRNGSRRRNEGKACVDILLVLWLIPRPSTCVRTAGVFLSCVCVGGGNRPCWVAFGKVLKVEPHRFVPFYFFPLPTGRGGRRRRGEGRLEGVVFSRT